MIHRLFLIASALVVAVIALAGLGTQPAAAEHFVTVTPELASRLVNTTHTVTAASQEFDGTQIVRYTFRVISGPNTGVNQTFGGCIPSSCTGGATNKVITPVSWTYTGSGGTGTDTIEVCGTDVRGATFDFDCDTVFVTWFRESGFPIGGAISDQAAENRARAAAAAPAAVVPPATGTGIITPPSTGDAGLLGSSSSSGALFAIGGMAAFALAGLATLKLARAKS